ncbi:TetR/AcrR family transcriptional regulator [Streptomyces longhuiensis]|uniref:TetR/AcrR family transcriptional regulator n=1 Tax=Streptomyces longhuiensis TaxID=2880933 RepID=UPI001D0A60C8|nr:TetR/AcrR family transcriptional regulator [Streptomyces longhuiensis]UDL97081.1 TetR/AcrR family transcriptional regulator [Streptomyces longhuiensis]
MPDQPAAVPTKRRRRTRQETEADLLDAALRLLERDGTLAGITLREVAKEAGVNHGQIYQYFGDRQTLLRAAIGRLLDTQTLGAQNHWEKPFSERVRAMLRYALDQPQLLRLEALLALDGDPELTLFPELEHTKAALERDRRDGHLPEDADGLVMHAMTAATYLGYCIFREALARDLGLDPDELDQRASAVYDLMLDGLVDGRRNPGPSAS